jgi:hypothetical protein
LSSELTIIALDLGHYHGNATQHEKMERSLRVAIGVGVYETWLQLNGYDKKLNERWLAAASIFIVWLALGAKCNLEKMARTKRQRKQEYGLAS